MILAGNTLYGTAETGGTNGEGTVFAVNTDGTGFTNLHNFGTPNGNYYTNSDGGFPYGSLILSGGTLYGTASAGGTYGSGTVFALNTNGTGFTNLYNFSTGLSIFPYGPFTNSDGINPWSALILAGNTLYGTAQYGGSGVQGNGTVFAVTTNGTDFATLHDFISSDGSYPEGSLVLSGNTLYGTAASGGTNGNGTVFSLSYPSPQLSITSSGTNANVMWPSSVAGYSYSGYTLQSTTNLVSTALWAAVYPEPVVVNGQNVVTNAISGTQQFYRLSH